MAENTPWDIERHGDDWYNITDRYGFSVAEAVSPASAARLIAAAPDMLAALVHVEAVMTIVPPRTAKAEYLDALAQVRAAIAKAEGSNDNG